MVEEQIYWVVVAERWADPANFDRGPRQFFAAIPAPLRQVVVAMVKRSVRQSLNGQGMGRHSAAERLILAERALDAIASIVGDRHHLGGDTPCGADASLGAFTITGRCDLFDSAYREALERRAPLVAYSDRMKARFFPEGPTPA